MTLNIESNLQIYVGFLKRADLQYKDYQYDGVKWCLTNELRPEPSQGVRGGFIADEMGLGKTITMLGTLSANPLPYTLIVVPPILIPQWQLQVIRTMHIEPLVYHGPIKKKITLETLCKTNIVITSYGAITMNRQQIEHKQHTLLHQHSWDRIIFDESHHMRNSNTKLHYSAQLLNANIRWLVSGTPVQNSKQDFYSLCSLIKLPPSFYSDKDNLREIGKSFILKRTKKQVGILIPHLALNDTVIDWENPIEKNISKEIHACLPFANIQTQESHFNSAKAPAIVHMIRAKQSCITLQLLHKSIHNYTSSLSHSSKPMLTNSSKINHIITFIHERKNNQNGKIIFCNYKQEIDLFQQRLRLIGLSVAVIDGRVNKLQRNIILSQPYDALILQIQTGCEGLNLQEYYSEIYFVSPHWNPAVEDQAIARCHRIGQTKSVNVFRFHMQPFDQHRDKDDNDDKDDKDDNRQQLPTINIETYTNSLQHNKRVITSSIL